MTEEELREEATSTVEWESVPMIDRPLFVFAYVKGALTREKRIEELEAQIEKMKCCRNCKYDGGLVCLYKTDCKNRDKWELAD